MQQFSRLKRLKGRFTFRLGATSYIVPADIETNVRLLADIVDDVELLLFESEELAPLPDERQIGALRSIASENALSYTAHLPLDAALGHPEEVIRVASVQKCIRAARSVSALEPLAYIVHFERAGDTDHDWQRRLAQSAGELVAAGLEGHRICVEVLDYPFELVEDIVFRFGLSICLDVGHALAHRLPLEAYLDLYFAHVHVVHLHGIRDGKDHRSIAGINERLLAALMERFREASWRERVVTLELFEAGELAESLPILERYAE